jgi:alkylation response protein AidB-like acyl-CoA dehydrogenase
VAWEPPGFLRERRRKEADMEGTMNKGGSFLIEDIGPDQVFTPEDFNEEHRLVARSAEEFAQGEVLSRADELEVLNYDLIRSLMRRAGELGLLSADIPEVYGGSGLDKVSSTLITEKMTTGGTSFTVTFADHTGIGSLPIVFFGTPQQKERYLPKLATGEFIAAYALTESEHGSDALRCKTTAMLSPDGKHYILNGQKQFITNGGFADLFLTYAQVDGEKFTGFIVERNSGGLSLDEEEKKMGVHGTSTRAVIFEDVKVPLENVLGEIGRGHIVALNTLNIGRFKLGGACIGGAKTVLAEAIRYAKQRVQFGKPISDFGLIKHKIAEMALRVYVTESMVYRTAGLIDQALHDIDPTTEDAGRQTANGIREYATECSINKVYGSEMLDYVVDEAVQILGGYGYIQDYLPERAYRDSRINRIWEGTNEINRMLVLDMLTRKAMKGELALLPAIQKLTGEFMSYTPSLMEAEVTPLGSQRKLLEMAKKIGLLAAGVAFQKHLENLREEQEIVALIADMVIEIFAMESTLLRTLKKVEKSREEEARIHVAATKVYIDEAFPRVEVLARQVLGAVSQGDELRTQLAGLKKFTRYTPINAVALRREIANSVLGVSRYHLSP